MNHFDANYDVLKIICLIIVLNVTGGLGGLGSNNLCRLVQILMNGSRANSLRQRSMSELAQAPLLAWEYFSSSKDFFMFVNIVDKYLFRQTMPVVAEEACTGQF